MFHRSNDEGKVAVVDDGGGSSPPLVEARRSKREYCRSKGQIHIYETESWIWNRSEHLDLMKVVCR